MRARFRPGGDFFVLFAAATELQEVSTTDVNSGPSQLPSVGPTEAGCAGHIGNGLG